MITSCVDDSGHSHDTDFVTMAGLVADEQSWALLESKWRKTLRVHGLSRWHTVDYAHSLNEYSTWKGDEQKRQQAYGDFLGVIEEMGAVPIGGTVSMRHWNSMSPRTKRLMVDPYFLVMQDCLHSSSAYRTGMSSTDKLRLVFDDNREFKGRVPGIYKLLKQNLPFGDQLLGQPIFMGAASPRIQAADIVAFEVRQFQDNSLKRPHLGPRWGYKQLTQMALQKCKFGPVPWFSNFGEEALGKLDAAVLEQSEN